MSVDEDGMLVSIKRSILRTGGGVLAINFSNGSLGHTASTDDRTESI